MRHRIGLLPQWAAAIAVAAFLLTLPAAGPVFAASTCADIDFIVQYSGDTGDGCFGGLTLVLRRADCKDGCFAEFSGLKLKGPSGYRREWSFAGHSEQITNPLVLMLKAEKCLEDKPGADTFHLRLEGARTCELTMSLKEEHSTWKRNVEEQEKRAAERAKVEEAQREANRLAAEEAKAEKLRRLEAFLAAERAEEEQRRAAAGSAAGREAPPIPEHALGPQGRERGAMATLEQLRGAVLPPESAPARTGEVAR